MFIVTVHSNRVLFVVVLLLTDSSTIINDLDVILHGFMLQIINTMVFWIKRLNNLTLIMVVSSIGGANRSTRENHRPAASH